MQHGKRFASFALAAGMVFGGALALRADDGREWRGGRQEWREPHRDSGRLRRLREEEARLRWRLDRDYAIGDRRAARRDERALERVRHQLRKEMREPRDGYRDGWNDRR